MSDSNWTKWLAVPIVIGSIGLGGAVSSWAADAASSQSGPNVPAQYAPVQDESAPPDGEDCPEKDGRGDGAGPSGDTESAPAPAAPTTTPDV